MPCHSSLPAEVRRLAQASHQALDYRRHYRALLATHGRPQEAVAELYLFRFWLARRALLHAATGGDPPGPLLPRPRVPQADARWIEPALGGTWIVDLVEERCDLYDRFLMLGRQKDDPLGLGAATLALACQLFAEPAQPLLAWLRRETHDQFQAVLHAATAAVRDRDALSRRETAWPDTAPSPPPRQP